MSSRMRRRLLLCVLSGAAWVSGYQPRVSPVVPARGRGSSDFATPAKIPNDADRWRQLASSAGAQCGDQLTWRNIAQDLSQLDAALCEAAREAAARFGKESREARVSWSLVEECRRRDARHTQGRRSAGDPPSASEAELELLSRLRGSRAYVAWLKNQRSELRRLAAAGVLDAEVASIPLASLATPWRSSAPRARHDASAAISAAQTARADESAVMWDIAEEVLASDNSIAATPSLEEDQQIPQPEAMTLSLELALEYVEQLSWRAEVSGAFGGQALRARV